MHRYSNVVQNVNFEYISANLQDVTLAPNTSKELGNIDYSGRTASGKGVAGLAVLDSTSRKLIPDPVLYWDVPREWTLEDAVTVPQAYCVVNIFFTTTIECWEYYPSIGIKHYILHNFFCLRHLF